MRDGKFLENRTPGKTASAAASSDQPTTVKVAAAARKLPRSSVIFRQ